LLGPRAKLARAAELLDTLDEELEAGFDIDGAGPVIIERLIDRAGEITYVTFVLAGLKSPPLRVGTLVSDAIHNLRTCLDQIAWQLAKLTNPRKQPPKGTYFPICATKSDFESATTRKKLLGIDAQYVREIRDLQPFVDAANAALLDLSRLSNRDKHRVMSVVALGAEDPKMILTPTKDSVPRHDIDWEVGIFGGVPLFQGQELMKVPVNLSGQRSTLDLELEAFFYAGLHSGENIGVLLDSCREIVGDFVERLEEVFDTEKGRKLGAGFDDGLSLPSPRPQRVVVKALSHDGQVIATATGEMKAT
jgi:hypothetical protein